MRKILIATTNLGKIKEFQTLFPNEEILSLLDINYKKEIKETGTTFEENAILKARQVSLDTNLTVIADDSGLEVKALNGAPGVFSARYAKSHDSDANNQLLIKNLAGITERRARFVCAICICTSDGKIYVAKGMCEGSITDKPKGENGFGYDPYFYIEELGKTMAELPVEVKNKISHRGKAIQILKEIIEKENIQF